MVRASKKNRKIRLRRLAALAAIGLISFSSPALANQTIDTPAGVVNGDASAGLNINLKDNANGTSATWNATSPGVIGGVIFSDKGFSGGATKLTVTGLVMPTINGDIINNNISTDSSIDIDDSVTLLRVKGGDIRGNSQAVMTINNDKSIFLAEDSDVLGKVNFLDTDASGTAGASAFVVKSIGEGGAATVKTGGADKVSFGVDGNFGAVGGSSLTLAGTTAATIGGNIGGATMAGANTITLAGKSSLAVAGVAMGALNVTNNKGTFTLDTIGDTADLTLGGTSGRVEVKNIVGTVSIKAQDASKGLVVLEDGDGDPTTRLNLGNTNLDLNLTLGADDDATADTLTLVFGDKIVGSADGSTSTKLNINTRNVVLKSTNSANAGNNPDVEGHVKVNLIGGTNGSTANLTLGELKNGATLTAFEDTPGENNKSVIFRTANTTKGTVSIVNETENNKAVVIQSLSGGILNVGNGGVDETQPKAASVWVNDIVDGDSLTIESMADDYGQVTLDMNKGMALDLANGTGSTTKIALGNAILKISENTAANTDLGWNDTFSMDSTKGDSHLIGESEAGTPGTPGHATANKLVFSNAPTIEVGAGGDVIIESVSLDFQEALKTSSTVGAIGSGVVHFADPGNGNKMIFASSDNTNTFSGGVQIEEGNFEFKGSTNIMAKAGDSMKNSQLHFTGNSVIDSDGNGTPGDPTDDPRSDFTVQGNIVDAAGTKLSLNNYINVTYATTGSLNNLDTVVLGDIAGAKTNITFGDVGTKVNTVLKATHIDANAATLDNVFIGQLSEAPSNPDATKTVSFNNGLQGTDITLNDKVLVEGGLYIDANGAAPVLKIGQAEGGFVLTDNAITENSYIEDGSVVQISKAAFADDRPTEPGQGGRIRLLQAQTGSDPSLTDFIATKLVPSLVPDLAFLGNDVEWKISSDGTIYYDKLPKDNVQDDSSVPKFARPMLSALRSAGDNSLTNDLEIVADALAPANFASSDIYNRELTMVMGNTMNSSLSLIQNGTAVAFGRLNATAPTIGYNTAVAVSAPRPRVSTQAAPSTAIGVPIRATDVPPTVGSQPQPASSIPPAPIAPASGSADERPNGLWIAPQYAQMSMDGDYANGYGDADVKSVGVVLGYDKWVNENGRLGAFMSYSSPELEDDFQDISADDLQFGVYAQGIAPNGVIVNGALAMGRQDYNSRRDVKFRDPNMGDFNQELKADYGGKTMNAALEVSRPVELNNGVYMRPSIGYSYQNIKLKDIKEESTVANAKSLAQKISSNSFNIQQARLGTDIGWVNPDNTVTVGARAFLVANMGDTQPEGRAAFISAGNNAQKFNVYGAELDDAMANLGLGLKFTPSGAEGMIISLDYDAMLGSNTQAHSLGLMFRYEF